MANERTKHQQEQGRTSPHDVPGRQEHRGGGGSRGPRESALTTSGFSASPFSLMRRFMDDLDHLFVGGTSGAEWAPAVEVLERDGRLVVRADVPGLQKDDVNVEIDDGHLVISGEPRQEHEDRQEGFYRTERTYGRFCRALALPEEADAEHAKATFKNGVLEISMPMTGRHQARRLQVEDAGTAGAH